jgi:hypothetical protein
LRANIVGQPLIEIKDVAGQDLIVISHRSEARVTKAAITKMQPRNRADGAN